MEVNEKNRKGISPNKPENERTSKNALCVCVVPFYAKRMLSKPLPLHTPCHHRGLCIIAYYIIIAELKMKILYALCLRYS